MVCQELRGLLKGVWRGQGIGDFEVPPEGGERVCELEEAVAGVVEGAEGGCVGCEGRWVCHCFDSGVFFREVW